MPNRPMPPNDESEAWAHIHAERFDEAEAVVCALVERSDPGDHQNLWHLFGLLGSILNSLGRNRDATSALETALAQARQISNSATTVDVSRFMLGNQYLLFGNPQDALGIVQPIPPGAGHLQCLLSSVAAEAMWALARHDDAREAARNAVAAAPTDKRRAAIISALAYILDQPP